MAVAIQAIQTTPASSPVTPFSSVAPHAASQLSMSSMFVALPVIISGGRNGPSTTREIQVPLKDPGGIARCCHCHHRSSGVRRSYPESPWSEHESMFDHWSMQRLEAPADQDLEIDRRLEKMDCQFEAIRNLLLIQNDGINNELPFNDKIMRASLPWYFKIP